jgi:hypothetical protein
MVFFARPGGGGHVACGIVNRQNPGTARNRAAWGVGVVIVVVDLVDLVMETRLVEDVPIERRVVVLPSIA